jgi:hypothetical protein
VFCDGRIVCNGVGQLLAGIHTAGNNGIRVYLAGWMMPVVDRNGRVNGRIAVGMWRERWRGLLRRPKNDDSHDRRARR